MRFAIKQAWSRRMRYPAANEPGDEKHAFGVVVPDLPGCFSAGDTLDEGRARPAFGLLGDEDRGEGLLFSV